MDFVVDFRWMSLMLALTITNIYIYIYQRIGRAPLDRQ